MPHHQHTESQEILIKQILEQISMRYFSQLEEAQTIKLNEDMQVIQSPKPKPNHAALACNST